MIRITSYTRVLFRDGEWVIGYIAELPRCVAQERTFRACGASLNAALKDTLAHYKRHGLPVPAPGAAWKTADNSAALQIVLANQGGGVT